MRRNRDCEDRERRWPGIDLNAADLERRIACYMSRAPIGAFAPARGQGFLDAIRSIQDLDIFTQRHRRFHEIGLYLPDHLHLDYFFIVNGGDRTVSFAPATDAYPRGPRSAYAHSHPTGPSISMILPSGKDLCGLTAPTEIIFNDDGWCVYSGDTSTPDPTFFLRYLTSTEPSKEEISIKDHDRSKGADSYDPKLFPREILIEDPCLLRQRNGRHFATCLPNPSVDHILASRGEGFFFGEGITQTGYLRKILKNIR